MAENQPNRVQWLTVKEVAAELQVSVAWVYAHASGARRPVLCALRTGGLVRIHPADLDAFLKECRQPQKWNSFDGRGERGIPKLA